MDTSKIIQSNINNYRKQEKVMSDFSTNTFSPKTLDFSDRILNSDSEDIISFLNNKTKLLSKKDSSFLYLYDNFLLYRSGGNASIQLEENLKLFKDNPSVPKFVKFFQLGDNDFLSLVEINQDDILPYKQTASQIPEAVKQKFKANIQKITNQGFINRKIFTDKDSFFVTKNNNNIIFADWSEIHILSPQEKLQMNETLKNWKI